MPISLQKGQKVSLTKGNPGLTKVVVGLGWDVNSFDTGGDFDLDAAAFLLGESGKVTSSGDFVFYGNLKHSSGAVEHLGDNLTGEGAGDDEQIRIDLTKVPASIQRIAFTVTIYEAESRRQNFGMVNNAFIRIFDETNGQEMLRYDLGEDFSIESAAAFVHRSPSYLMKHFKSELGVHMGAYITRCKLEEAQSLLAYSDKTLAEISSYLCFSSQSYFQNVFKKQYGVTPLAYRKQARSAG